MNTMMMPLNTKSVPLITKTIIYNIIQYHEEELGFHCREKENGNTNHIYMRHGSCTNLGAATLFNVLCLSVMELTRKEDHPKKFAAIASVGSARRLWLPR